VRLIVGRPARGVTFRRSVKQWQQSALDAIRQRLTEGDEILSRHLHRVSPQHVVFLYVDGLEGDADPAATVAKMAGDYICNADFAAGFLRIDVARELACHGEGPYRE